LIKRKSEMIIKTEEYAELYELVPRYEDAIVLYPWISRSKEEWENSRAIENIIYMLDNMKKLIDVLKGT